MKRWAEPFVLIVFTISPSSPLLCLHDQPRRRPWTTGSPCRPWAFCNKLNSLKRLELTPLYFHPRSPDSSPRAERRCKNKQDVWISAHKRLTTHAPRVALFCLYLGIFPPSTVSCHLERASDGISAIGRHMMGRQVDNRHVKRLTTHRRLCTHPCHSD